MFDNRIGREYMDETAPDYGFANGSVAFGVATVLIVLNIVGMYALAFTPVADAVIWLYQDAPFAPMTGIIVLSIPISLGYYLGVSRLHGGVLSLGLGVALAEVGFSAFGAGVLSLYPQELWFSSLGIAAGGTAAVALLFGLVVISTDWYLGWLEKVSAGLFIGGFLVFIAVTVLGGGTLSLLGFGLILLGWVADLGYTIWLTSSREHTPVRNGVAIYIAFTGVMVHILQLVLEMMAQAE